MKRNTNSNNQISLDNFQKNINRSFIVSLSANSLLDEVRNPNEGIASDTFLDNSLRQLKWIADQTTGLEEYMLDVFDVYPNHPYRLKIRSLFGEIYQHIEKAQSALIYVNLNEITDADDEVEKNRLEIYLYNLNNTLTSLYTTLKNTKFQNN